MCINKTVLTGLSGTGFKNSTSLVGADSSSGRREKVRLRFFRCHQGFPQPVAGILDCAIIRFIPALGHAEDGALEQNC